MATGLNKVTLIGNLGKDPEVRYTQGGTAVCNMRIGVTERRKEGDSWKDQTEWFTIISFGKTAENAGRFLKKGRQVFVEGRLQTRSWEDKEGQTRYTTEVVANQMIFLGGGRESSDNSDYTSPSSFGGSSTPKNDFSEHNEFASHEFMEEDIPF